MFVDVVEITALFMIHMYVTKIVASQFINSSY